MIWRYVAFSQPLDHGDGWWDAETCVTLFCKLLPLKKIRHQYRNTLDQTRKLFLNISS
jgi:hypothetical protein